MTFDQWLIFVAVWIAAGLPLGPSALNCIAAAAAYGLRRSLWSIVGILLAAFCLMAASILGLATLLLANAEALQVLKLIGAGYLIWLGIALWRKGDAVIQIDQRANGSASKRSSIPAAALVRRAFLVAMSNPKAILVYLAVFSQFIHPDLALDTQLMILMPTAQVITAAIYFSYCAAGSGIGRLLRTARRRLIFNRGIGGVYAACGVGLVATER